MTYKEVKKPSNPVSMTKCVESYSKQLTRLHITTLIIYRLAAIRKWVFPTMCHNRHGIFLIHLPHEYIRV